jgi:hypothetical protein
VRGAPFEARKGSHLRVRGECVVRVLGRNFVAPNSPFAEVPAPLRASKHAPRDIYHGVECTVTVTAIHVIPAKAGIRLDLVVSQKSWIPAFAGMTGERVSKKKRTHHKSPRIYFEFLRILCHPNQLRS